MNLEKDRGAGKTIGPSREPRDGVTHGPYMSIFVKIFGNQAETWPTKKLKNRVYIQYVTELKKQHWGQQCRETKTSVDSRKCDVQTPNGP